MFPPLPWGGRMAAAPLIGGVNLWNTEVLKTLSEMAAFKVHRMGWEHTHGDYQQTRNWLGPQFLP